MINIVQFLNEMLELDACIHWRCLIRLDHSHCIRLDLDLCFLSCSSSSFGGWVIPEDVTAVSC